MYYVGVWFIIEKQLFKGEFELASGASERWPLPAVSDCHHPQVLPVLPPCVQDSKCHQRVHSPSTLRNDICCSLQAARQSFTLRLLYLIRGFRKLQQKSLLPSRGSKSWGCAALRAEKTPGTSNRSFGWEWWQPEFFPTNLLAPKHFAKSSDS